MSVSTVAARLRVILFWFHLALGVAGGAVILLMSATGALLGFERQVIAAVDGAPTVQPPPGAARLPLDSLLHRAGLTPAVVSIVSLRRDPRAPVQLRHVDRKRGTVLLDPYTGAVLPPSGSGRAQAAMQALRRWHRWVGQVNGGGWGRGATGAANLLFLLLVCSGVYLWWPRQWTLTVIRSLAILDFRLSGKARDFNWHHALGLWSLVPLFVIALSGVFMSYQWPQAWITRWSGAPAPISAPLAGAARFRATGTVPAGPPSLDQMRATAESKRPDWTTLSLVQPAADEPTFTVTAASGNGFRPDLKTILTFDARTGALAETREYGDLGAARRWRNWMRYLHTGEVFGLGGQAVATLVSLAAVVLVVTGIALAVRRFLHWRARPVRLAA